MKELIFSKATNKKYKEKIAFLGPYNKMTAETFLLSRLFIEIILLFALNFIPKYGLLISIIVVILFHILYNYILLDYKIDKRNRLLYDECLIFLSMVRLSLENKENLSHAVEESVEHLGSALSLEFKKSLKKNAYHNDINKVFNDCLKNIPNKDVRVALIDLKESDNYKVSIEKIINDLEEKSILKERERAKILPVFLTIILSIIVFAICLLLTFGTNLV